jgi:hypothetical protein
MAVIAYTDRGGSRSYVVQETGRLHWSESIADADEFADAAAVTAFLAGKTDFTIANGSIGTLTAGPRNISKKQH